MPSSIPAARLALFNMLDAAPALSAAQTTYGPPEAHTEEHKVVAILGVESVATEDVNVGGARQEERYAINLRLKVHDPSCNGDAAELQAIDAEIWGYYEAVRAAIQATPTTRTLNGALTDGWATVAAAGPEQRAAGLGESPVPALTEEGAAWGWVSFVDVRIECRARVA